MNNEKIYYVKRMRLLIYLTSRGFRDYEVVPDPTSSKKGFNWFLFERTPEFDKAIEEYFAQFS